MVWLRRSDEDLTDTIEKALAALERFPALFGREATPDSGVDPEFDLVLEALSGCGDPSLIPWDVELFDPEHDTALLHGGVDIGSDAVSIPLDAIAFMAWHLDAPTLEDDAGASDGNAGT